MSHPYHHSLSSARKYGGKPEDYQAIHDWFDESKAFLPDIRHRALRHHAEGIFMLESLFGATIVNADGRTVPVRLVGEQHVREDLGFIPSFADWARLIAPEAWMLRGNPLDEHARGAEGNAGAAGDEVLVRSCAGDEQPVRIAI